MTIIIDNISIIAAIVLAVLTLAATLTDVFLCKPKTVGHPLPASSDATEEPEDGQERPTTEVEAAETEDEDEEITGNPIATEGEGKGSESNFPPVSIIVTPHNNALELEQNLPLLLEQDYPAPYKVIVVFWRGESDTDDVLKKHAANPRLYSTYIPESSRYMSRKKLAITVGEKAADTEWLLLTDITCRPQSNQWLRCLARHATPSRNLVIGHTRYDDDTPPFRRFLRSYTSLYLMKEAERGTAYRCESNALMLRRSEFEQRDGFRSNLKYLRGEYDFTVNDCARPGSTAIECSPEGTLIERCPTTKEWRNKLLYYLADRQGMLRTATHRWRHNVGQTLLHASVVALLGSITFGILTQRWPLAALAVLLLIATVAVRTWLACRALNALDEGMAAWRVFPYEMRMLWHTLALKIRYWRANKDDFTTHKG